MHGLGWVVCLDIVPQRQAFDGKTVFFSALRRAFSKFRRLYRERGKAVFIQGRHCVRQSLFPFRRSFWPMLARVLTADKGSAGDLALLERCSRGLWFPVK